MTKVVVGGSTQNNSTAMDFEVKASKQMMDNIMDVNTLDWLKSVYQYALQTMLISNTMDEMNDNNMSGEYFIDKLARHILSTSHPSSKFWSASSSFPLNHDDDDDDDDDDNGQNSMNEVHVDMKHLFSRQIEFQHMLRILAPISMDLAIRISYLVLSESKSSSNKVKNNIWATALVLFGNWLPLARHLDQIASDLFQSSSSSSPLEDIFSPFTKDQERYILTSAINNICNFFASRGNNVTLQKMSSWGDLLSLLQQYTKDENLTLNRDVEMEDVSDDDDGDDDNTLSDEDTFFDKDDHTLSYGIKWHIGRALASILDLRPNNRALLLQRVHARNEKPRFQLHIDVIKNTFHRAMHEKKAEMNSLWNWPQPHDVRSVIPLHSSLVWLDGGITLPKWSTTSFTIADEENKETDLHHDQRLILTPTTKDNLSLLGLALCEDPYPPPTLVCGPSGSGKSSLIREMAHMCHANLLELHLDEETDSKTLLGTYTATDIPGEFIWRPGALTRAAREGRWVLLEDTDVAPQEILDALLPLLENRTLPLPKERERVHPKFRLFGTMTTVIPPGSECHREDLPFHSGPGGRRLLQSGVWRKVHVDPLSFTELGDIARRLYPTLPSSVVESCLKTLRTLDASGRLENNRNSASTSPDRKTESESNDETQDESDVSRMQEQRRRQLFGGGRSASVRDFRKLCHRIASVIPFESSASFATESQRMLCLSEAFDVFCAACPTMEGRRAFITEFASPIWQISKDLALKYLEARKPTYEQKSDFLEVGRAILPILENGSRLRLAGNTSKFAPTPHSLRLMESIAVSISLNEPTLLVGETGCGKTTLVQRLAASSNRELIVQNLSLQTDSTDLLGGYRPVELKHLARKLYINFVELFIGSFSREKNKTFLDYVNAAFEKGQWKRLSQCFIRGANMGLNKLKENNETGEKVEPWTTFLATANRFERQRVASDSGLAFAFTEGALVEAIRTGKWVLLDEINLASSETLLRLCGLLDDAHGSVILAERGDSEALKRHPDFRLIAAMNPATDSGKKDLPASMRSRFTEFYVDELVDPIELRTVAARYLSEVVSTSEIQLEHSDTIITAVNVYLKCRELSEESLVDGGGQRPRYTLRTLCRALSAARDLVIQQRFSIKRALLEGFELAFEGPLDDASRKALRKILSTSLGNGLNKKELNQPMRRPGSESEYVLSKPFWIKVGAVDCIDWAEGNSSKKHGRSKFVLTESALTHLRRISRAVAAGPWPVLLEGPTSAGKTTLVEYLAARCGHRCIRINNHEHTDVQEYTGSYVADSNGSLVFKEGLLVQALRRGDWIILDELNLAPSEVLEALNRLLDDNRELYLPETNETIVARPSFKLFATQNPCGAYGGRKPLSRAFRNRFVEVHVGDIPSEEMIKILEIRCECPPSHAKLLVKVMITLRQRRSKSGVFRGKDGLITPRDLLRWAERGGMSKAELALEGFMLLAERLRDNEEKGMVKDVIEETFKVKIDQDNTYYGENSDSRRDLTNLHAMSGGIDGLAQAAGLSVQSIAPTSSLLRMLRLVKRCVEQKEPVLLVGDTGCGKTTVVQLLSVLLQRNLHVINCHASTETSDILGGLRPLRGRETILTQIVEKTNDIFLKYYNELYPVIKRMNVPSFITLTNADQSMSDAPNLMDKVDDSNKRDAGNFPTDTATKSFSFVRTLLASCTTTEPILRSDTPEKPIESKSKKKKKNKRRKLESGKASSDNQHDSDNVTLVSVSCYNFIKTVLKEIESLNQRYASLFEWVDGPLVEAMRKGHLLLLDEMSLAEDAVLERLNSILEPTRKLVLAEKGGSNSKGYENNEICAHEDFRIFATMNPGGDFGKRELSPALRSRFTEIWVPAVTNKEDIDLVIESTLAFVNGTRQENSLSIHSMEIRKSMLDYVEWFNVSICKNPSLSCADCTLSLRDVIAWAKFIIDVCTKDTCVPLWMTYVHGAALMHLDGLGIGTAGLSIEDAERVKQISKEYLRNQIPEHFRNETMKGFENELEFTEVSILDEKSVFGIHPFYTSLGPEPIPNNIQFNMSAPTTNMNLRRVLRGLQLSKPILLEGSPGVGKTSLISALAKASGHNLVRINLSEQTDISDLMGTDLPIPEDASNDAKGKTDSANKSLFRWCDGVFLQALKQGDWVLLDELNLATQSVLEGLNSCLDHRAQVYIPELGTTINCPPTFRIFAAQNPLGQGGGRKGLPKSFLNRFTKVYVEALKSEDLQSIVINRYPSIQEDLVKKMIEFNSRVQNDIVDNREYGQLGSPWEFNLRDVFRWCDLMVAEGRTFSVEDAGEYVNIIYIQRLRTWNDREMLKMRYQECFGTNLQTMRPFFDMTENFTQIGNVFLRRNSQGDYSVDAPIQGTDSDLIRSLFRPMESVGRCINMNWPCLIVGNSSSGKSTVLRTLAQSSNMHLEEVAMTSSSDVSELIGCYEQIDTAENEEHLVRIFKNLHEKALQILVDGNIDLKNICSLFRDLTCELEEYEHKQSSCKSVFRDTSIGNVGKSLLLAFEDAIKAHEKFSEISKANVILARNLLKSIQSEDEGSSGLFRWVDGILVTAMEKGYWLHLENVNFCPSSVLDRLNPLMEIGGELVLTECGIMSEDKKPRAILPHKNFRLFLSMNPKSGEVSRAMRNRCVEICLLSPSGSEILDLESDPESDIAAVTIQSFDALEMLLNFGIRSASHAINMIKCHMLECLNSEKHRDNFLSMRDLKAWSVIKSILIERGWSGLSPLSSSFQFLYGYSKYSTNMINLLESSLTTDQYSSMALNRPIDFGKVWLSDPRCARVLQNGRLFSLVSNHSEDGISSDNLPFELTFLNTKMASQSELSSKYDEFSLDSSELLQLRSLLEIYLLARFIGTSSYDDWFLRLNFIKQVYPKQAHSITYVMKFIRRALARFGMNNETLQIEGLQLKLVDQSFDFRDNVQLFNIINTHAPSKFVGNAKTWITYVERRLNYIRSKYLTRLSHLLREQMTYEKLRSYDCDKININQMSPIDLSYLFNNGSVDRSILNCLVTPSLFPFFEAIDDLLHNWELLFVDNIDTMSEDLSPIYALLSCRDRLWVCLSSSSYCSDSSSSIKFEEDRFLVQWKWIKKSLFYVSNIFDNLNLKFENSLKRDLLDALFKSKRQVELLIINIDEVVFETTGNTIYSDLLWKKGGHPLVPARANDWISRANLRNLADSCSFIDEEKVGLTSLLAGVCMQLNLDLLVRKSHSCLFIDTNVKSDILAALSTMQGAITDEVRLSGETSEDIPDKFSSSSIPKFLMTRMKEARERFASSVKSATIDLEINTVENQYSVEELRKMQSEHSDGNDNELRGANFVQYLLEKWSFIQSTQLAEICCLSEELGIIGELSGVLLETRDSSDIAFKLRGVVPRIEKFIEAVATQTLWSVTDLRPYQTFIWAVESDSISPENLKHLLKCVFPIMNFSADNHSWCNTFNSLDIISNVLKSPSFWKKEDDGDTDQNSESDFVNRDIEDNNFQALHFGPTRLKQPVRSAAILRLSGLSSCALGLTSQSPHLTIENFEARKKQAKLITKQLAEFKMKDYRRYAPLKIKHLFVDVIESMNEYIADGNELLSILIGNTALSQQLERAKEIVKQCTYLPFQNLVHTVVLPLLNALARVDKQEKMGKEFLEEHVAQLWVFAGLLRLHLLLPSSPLDPGMRPAAKVSQWDKYLLDLGLKLTVLKLEARANSGGDVPVANDALDILKEAERVSNKRLIQSKKTVNRPKEAASFAQLYREMHRFSKTISNPGTVIDIVKLMTNRKTSSEQTRVARAKEVNWQSSVSSFCNRLVKHYNHYEDITIPFINAVRNIQQGLREIGNICDKEKYNTKALDHVLNSQALLLNYPMGVISKKKCMEVLLPSVDVETLIKTQLDHSGTNGGTGKSQIENFSKTCQISLLFAALTRMEMYIRTHWRSSDPDFIDTLSEMFSFAVESWMNNEEKRLASGSNDENNPDTTEEQRLEKEYREQFPDHGKEFRDIVVAIEDQDDYQAEESYSGSDDSSNTFELTMAQISLLCLVHREIFQNRGIKGVDDACRIRAFNMAYKASSDLMPFTQWYEAHGNEHKTIGAHMMGLAIGTNIRRVQSGTRFLSDVSIGLNESNILDFHHDANPEEAMKAESVLRRLLNRVAQLLTAFPGHPALLSVGQVAERLNRLDLRTVSIGKALAGLEVILRKAQEWEQHASQKVALGEALRDVSKLVTQWRKLELSSWPSLLDVRQRNHVNRARQHWPRMYKLILGEFHKFCDASEEFSLNENVNPLVRQSPHWVWKGLEKVLGKKLQTVSRKNISLCSELTKLLDGFLLSCSTGEFPERLELLGSFAFELTILCKQKNFIHPEQLMFARTLVSLFEHYSQFIPIITSHRDELREPIEKRLKDEVKLARWDEQTYYSLTESTEKSHFKLMRMMKEYDEVLEWRVNQILEKNFLYGVRSSSESESEKATSIPPNNTIFPQLKDQSVDNATEKSNDLLKFYGKTWVEIQGNERLNDKYLVGMSKYFNKLTKVLNGQIFSFDSYAKSGAIEANYLCDAVFDRIAALREPKVTTPMKQRALVDLFKTLKKQGYSNMKWSVSAEIQEARFLLQLPVPTVNEFDTNLIDGEKYFKRSVVELSRLRSEISVFGSEFMSQRETTLMLGFSNHGLSMLCQQRCLLSNLIDDIAKVDAIRNTFKEIGSDLLPAHQVSLVEQVHRFETQVKSALENLKQLLLLMKTSSSLLQGGSSSSYIRDLIAMLESSTERMKTTYSSYLSEKNCSIVSNRRIHSLTETKQAISDVKDWLMTIKKTCEDNKALSGEIFSTCLAELELAHTYAHECIAGKLISHETNNTVTMPDLLKTVSLLVEGSLLAAQSMHKKAVLIDEKKQADDMNEDTLETVWHNHRENAREWASINIDRFHTNMKQLVDQMKFLSEIENLPNDDKELCAKVSHNTSLMVGHIIDASKRRLEDFMLMYRSSSKLLYVLLRVFRVLVAKGFCVDNSEEQDGEGEGGDASGMNFEDDVEGTGMGEGEGKNDVTDQIENEEQLLGLKGDEDKNDEKKDDNKQLDEEEAETGMEMEGDFDGEMYDMPDKKENENENDEENEDEEELDREMGDDTSPNDDVVDEKMWDDEDEDDDSPQEEEKFEKDSKMKGEEGMTEEYRTKEDDEGNENEPEPKEDEGKHADSNEPKKDKEEEEQEGKDGDDHEDHPLNEDLEDNYEDNHVGVNVREDEEGEEADAEEKDDGMDLDELDLDDGEEGEDDTKENKEDAEDMDNEDSDSLEGTGGEMNQDMEEDDQDDVDESEAITASAQAAGEVDPENPEEEEEKEDEEKENEDNPQINVDNQDEQNNENAHGINAESGNDCVDRTEEEDEKKPEEEDDGNGMEKDEAEGAEGEEDENQGKGAENDDGGEGEWKADEQTSEGNGSENKKKMMDAPNPFRDPGDVEKFWHKKLNMIQDDNDAGESNDETEQKPENDSEQENQNVANKTFEFTKQGQSSTTQMLGNALDEDDAAQLDQDMKDDNENEDVEMEDNENMEDNDPDSTKDEEKTESRSKEQKEKGKSKQEKSSMDPNAKQEKDLDTESKPVDPNAENDDENKEDESDNASTDNEDAGEEGEGEEDADNKVVTDLAQLNVREDEDSSNKIVPVTDYGNNMMEVEHTTNVTSEDMIEARERWATLQAETNNMARRLCEKLRLVMEPLVATKLRGDYRTGKRINMKRVIGFIASGYRKDKIWLKRTKPSKRDYRVLIAVDDSESMLKSGAGDMALLTLATMANGMSQLEIGELGIASFGEEMRLLHPFGQPFTSENGANLVSSFKFDEKRTRTALCVESAMAALEHAGGESGSSMQLVFIISDGRIERDSRTKMRRLVREMSERNILLVMLIVEGNVDGKKKKDSIVNMKEVSFENGKPKVKYFIEDYPFPYYIVLEEMSSLPEVMGDALRQWFEMLSQIQNQGN